MTRHCSAALQLLPTQVLQLLPTQVLLRVLCAVNAAFDHWLPGAVDAAKQLVCEGDDAAAFDAVLLRLANAAVDTHASHSAGHAGHLFATVLRAQRISWADFRHSLDQHKVDQVGVVDPSLQQRGALLVAGAYIKHKAHVNTALARVASKAARGAATLGGGGSSKQQHMTPIATPAAMVSALGVFEVVAHAWLARVAVASEHLPHAAFRASMRSALAVCTATQSNAVAACAVPAAGVTFSLFDSSIAGYVREDDGLHRALARALGDAEVRKVARAALRVRVALHERCAAEIDEHDPAAAVGGRVGGNMRYFPVLAKQRGGRASAGGTKGAEERQQPPTPKPAMCPVKLRMDRAEGAAADGTGGSQPQKQPPRIPWCATTLAC